MNKGILYTSYFANWRRWNKLDAYIVAVTRYRPNYMNYKKEGIQELKTLAPSEELLKAYKNGLLSETKFREEYLDQISIDIEASNTLHLIQSLLDKGVNVCLLCYEKVGDFCHRNILTEVFDEIGYKTIEII